MKSYREYGDIPAKIALVHGGPGAPGEMAPVARELAPECGVLEPFQNAKTINGQIEELAGVLHDKGDIPIILIGYSWGAWLSGMVAARYPNLVQKLILISSGPFEERYATVWQNRMNRFSSEEQQEIAALVDRMKDPSASKHDSLLAQFGEYIFKTDSYHPVDQTLNHDHIPCNHDMLMLIWEEASALRRSGELLALFQRISCPIIAIHGDYDPHPARGVLEPLTSILSDFRFILLEKCGHCPWIEIEAKDQFYAVLKSEVTTGLQAIRSGNPE